MSYLRWDEGTAHPRAGGENLHRRGERFAYAGSSPRGRGKPTGAYVTVVRLRLIPARAGKTG